MADNITSFESAEIPSPEDIQGADAFYGAIQAAYTGLHEFAAPYSESTEMVRAYGEVMRYLELATMYADRMGFMARNPHLMPKKETE